MSQSSSNPTTRPNRRKTREGRVVSNAMAHDETNDLKTGDRVRLQETRPLSKTKRWRVLEVVERAK